MGSLEDRIGLLIDGRAFGVRLHAIDEQIGVCDDDANLHRQNAEMRAVQRLEFCDTEISRQNAVDVVDQRCFRCLEHELMPHNETAVIRERLIHLDFVQKRRRHEIAHVVPIHRGEKHLRHAAAAQRVQVVADKVLRRRDALWREELLADVSVLALGGFALHARGFVWDARLTREVYTTSGDVRHLAEDSDEHRKGAVWLGGKLLLVCMEVGVHPAHARHR
jgi:hypothetical protein